MGLINNLHLAGALLGGGHGPRFDIKKTHPRRPWRKLKDFVGAPFPVSNVVIGKGPLAVHYLRYSDGSIRHANPKPKR